MDHDLINAELQLALCLAYLVEVRAAYYKNPLEWKAALQNAEAAEREARQRVRELQQRNGPRRAG